MDNLTGAGPEMPEVYPDDPRMSTCKIAGCDDARVGLGWCQKHYNKAYKHDGDPLWERLPRVDECKVPDCDRDAKQNGWCGKHYQRWYKHGDALFPVRERESQGDQCKVPDCDGVPWARGWCSMHYNKARNHNGDPLWERPPRVRPQCKVPDCDRVATGTGTAFGWCSKHYNRNRVHGDPLIVRGPTQAPCKVPDCDGVTGGASTAHGWCQKHYSRNYLLTTTYGINMDNFDSMLAAQGGVCAGCGTDTPGGQFDQWHVDHDHETGSVRGLLCRECNLGLGFLKDNVNTLRRLTAYLERLNQHVDERPQTSGAEAQSADDPSVVTAPAGSRPRS